MNRRSAALVMFIAMVIEPPDQLAAPGATLHEDIPCHRCGYNLRGLTPPGDCPECGWDLRDSIETYRLSVKLLPPPDPAWARRIREGGWLALAAAALVLAVIVAPRDWFYMPFRNAPLSRTPGRILLLSLMCVAWVLAWASTWRLTSLEPRPGQRTFVARGARVLCTIYLFIPFAWAIATWSRQSPLRTDANVLGALEYFGAAGMALLMVRIVQLMNRRRALGPAIAATVLAVAIPALLWLLAPFAWYRRYEVDPSSLGLMLRIYMFPIGVPEIDWEVWRALLRGRNGHPLVWMFAVLPVATAYLAGRLIWLYRPAKPA